MNFLELTSNLADLLQKPLPGFAAQQKMMPQFRIKFPASNNPRNSAVLLLFYPDFDGIKILFIKRTIDDTPHSGQVSFPGGKYEPQDPDFVATALREAHEETGIDTKNVQVIGQLTPLYIPVSNFMVYPVVAYVTEKPAFMPNPREVEYLIEADLCTLFLPQNKGIKQLVRQNIVIDAPFYNASNNIIWGATAMILSELECLLESKQSFME